ncbi:hypothetical protein A8E47_15465 [Burkholderia cenocepacia]|nr:hypothetical protein A8D64_09965 [Burkholderia cenocepacia]ONN95154.1 hypothetical protein A8D63_05530 [Burkholderia cenocepacia]ONN95784.1 hypothetical protein A8D62_08455 [Burkholderia cenocepacia]ONO09443.1 hypothetical protein A8D67_13715 [Burkholderia cenocepacia]ONO71700.1 hypothetical protein A8D75_20730 [Burkholderia cenocepacia]
MAFALERQHVDPQPDTAHVDVDMVRNEAGRVRVGAMAVRRSVRRTWAGLAAATRAHPDFGRRVRCKRRRARMRDDRRVSARQRVRIRPRPPLRPLR